MIVGKIQDSELLLLERATLHGKLEEHDKALHILVHQLKDSAAAEEYCSWASASHDQSYRQNLFHQLLSVYLDPDVPGGAQTVAAVDLLNRNADVFDAVRVLKLLPEEWSLPLLRPFLCGALRASVHARCTSQVAVGLARAQNLQLQHDRVSSHDFNSCFYFQCQHRVKSHGAQSIHLIKIRIKIYFNVFRGIKLSRYHNEGEVRSYRGDDKQGS